jgi:SAM-dependent methyltransferase
MKNSDYTAIYKHYEETLKKFGPNYRGMDWPNADDLDKRFNALLQLIKPGDTKISLLDLGCGIGLMVDYLKKHNYWANVDYSGIDISEKMIFEAHKHHPEISFKTVDILKYPLLNESVDYIVMNGVLTEKVSLDQAEMVHFAQEIIHSAYFASRIGIAFNVMSTHVDWTRPDLFHWPLDEVAGFLVKKCSRNIVINMNYGLYEYIVYVYK